MVVLAGGGNLRGRAVSFFDLESNAWSSGNDYPVEGVVHGVGVPYSGGSLAIIGGREGFGTTTFDHVTLYDPETDSWTEGEDGSRISEQVEQLVAFKVKKANFPSCFEA